MTLDLRKYRKGAKTVSLFLGKECVCVHPRKEMNREKPFSKYDFTSQKVFTIDSKRH